MQVNTDQIPTKTMPFFSVTVKDNKVIACVHSAEFICWQSNCIFKKVCKMEGELK